MIVKYGSFSFNDNEAGVYLAEQRTILDGRGRARFKHKRIGIEGEIVANGPAAIDARLAVINDAFSLGGQDLSFLLSDGSTATHIGLDNLTSLSGVQIIQPVTVLVRNGEGHWATGLPFRIMLEATYLLSPGDALVSYSERIRYSGTGNGRFVSIELIEGAPQRQQTTQQTKQSVIQEGEAIGIGAQPEANAPIAPTLICDPESDFSVEAGTPTMVNGAYIEYSIRWAYRMEGSHDEFIAAGIPALPTPLLRDIL